LNSGSLYWQSTMSRIPSYPSLKERIVTHVAVLGGGMTGALCSALLAREGIRCALVEEHKLAADTMESNAGLLQFSNGKMLNDLAETIGETEAVRFYAECRKVLPRLFELAGRFPFSTGLHMRSSLYCASTSEDVPKLYKEYSLLRKHGFAVEWGSPHNTSNQLPIRKAAALVNHGDAEMNPMSYAHSLIAKAESQEALIFENTKVKKIERRGGRFVISTEDGEIIANHIVRASGNLPSIEGLTQMKSFERRSYMLATPANSLPGSWPYDCMMRETAKPRFFFRTTPDRRIIAGSSDDASSASIASSRYLAHRTDYLLSELGMLFPNHQWEAEYSWSGTFYDSRDGLPFLGESPEQPGIFHACGCGDNSTVYSMIAAEILLGRLTGREHPLASLLSGKHRELSSKLNSSFNISF
jgi:glycine/D-amino acid oxidase-like deaminating enzyme